MSKASLGELKHRVYSILRSKGKASVKEICSFLENTRKYTPIMTVMNRMVEKKELLREKQGAYFVYWVNEAHTKKMPQMLAQIKQNLFQGKTQAMVSHLLESDSNITKNELLELEKIINKMKDL